MDNFIKLLDKNLEFINYKIIDDTIYVNVAYNRHEVICPFCKTISVKIHSHYSKNFQDLPIKGKKVIIILNNRKMFCNNPKCKHKTFAEEFEFISPKSKELLIYL
ncbi:transposase family protein [Clostridium sp.]|uniref:transposase family protein n=1 Tax=Clostridium sp. TaxID=1506 RepID=UPI00283F5BE9|nr:transposase family protein [Clostridium sp.]MDR3594773.1 transposase family protein [Clostridium sp.]